MLCGHGVVVCVVCVLCGVGVYCVGVWCVSVVLVCCVGVVWCSLCYCELLINCLLFYLSGGLSEQILINTVFFLGCGEARAGTAGAAEAIHSTRKKYVVLLEILKMRKKVPSAGGTH